MESTLEEDPDAALSERIRNKDEKALGEFFKIRGGLFCTVMGQVLYCQADVDEVLAELMLQVWDNMLSYDRSKGKFLSWVMVMARRRAVDHFRRSAARHRMEDRLEEITNSIPLMEKYHREEVEDERYQRVLELLHSIEIPDEQRDCLHLHWLMQKSQRDISAELGVPLGTVKTRLELGMKKLIYLVESDSFFQKP